jgi:hypothetical protein
MLRTLITMPTHTMTQNMLVNATRVRRTVPEGPCGLANGNGTSCTRTRIRGQMFGEDLWRNVQAVNARTYRKRHTSHGATLTGPGDRIWRGDSVEGVNMGKRSVRMKRPFWAPTRRVSRLLRRVPLLR